MKKWITLLIITMALYHSVVSSEDPKPENIKQKAVLVTGASRGLGLKMTEHLSAAGYLVYAGARNEADMKRLDQMKNVKSIRLDVTDQEQIKAAVATIEKSETGLYGLVNNAGIASVSPLIDMDEKDLDALMQVNVFGPYRITKAFAPLIIKQKGRIVTIGSLAGIASDPGLGAYSMSKHAMEAFTDTLAVEMKKSGVQVSIVEPGNYSPIFKGGDPIDVAQAVEHAISDPVPKRRYLVVPDQASADRALSVSFAELLQLNQQQKYSKDLEQLIQILRNQFKNYQ